ncbi:DUF362 domain-containing protein [Eubacteriaceae bacterium ES3]|nr:DUF362 domain-containing protein [Eubacteriaceae bacterium ES3]
MESKKSRVVIIGCESYDRDLVYQRLKTGIDLLGGIEQFVAADEKVLLKPNLLRGKDPDAALTTHPSVFEAVIRILQDAGIDDISFGDSPGVGTPAGAAKTSRLMEVANDFSIPLADFKDGETVDFFSGKVTKKFQIANGVLETDAIINLPKMKTHGLTRITGAVKNSFGCVYGLNKGLSHGRYQDAGSFSKMLIDLNRYLSGKMRLSIMDGILMMEGNGPASGNPRIMEVLMISDDPVALDATFARMIDLAPDYVPTIKYGHEMGLGSKDTEEILLLGDEFDLFYDPDFDVTRKPVDSEERSILAGFSKLNGLLLQKPVVDKDKCIGCGVCMEACPLEKKAIKMVKRSRRTYPLYLYHNCIRCYCCQEMCPEGAISVKTPLLGKLLV